MNQLLESLIEDDIFKPASKEEQKQRESMYRDIRIKEIAEELKKRGKLQPDGTYDFDNNIYISKLDLNSIKELGIRFGKVGGSFWCNGNNLTSLEGAPKEVGGGFYCSNNKLTSLEGVPKEVGGDFSCHYNELTSLEGAPKEVGGGFDCSDNQLTSLHGAPEKVGGSFYCYNNNITSLEGAPKEVGGYFDCHNNKKRFTEKEVRAVCNVKGKTVV